MKKVCGLYIKQQLVCQYFRMPDIGYSFQKMCLFCSDKRTCYFLKQATDNIPRGPLGYYNEHLFCPSCSSRSCRTCVFKFATTNELQCPNPECHRPLVDPVQSDMNARLFTFRHEVIDGDFSDEMDTEDAMHSVIARYILRGHLFVAGDYTTRYILKNTHQHKTEFIFRDIVAKARTYLHKYRLHMTMNQYRQDLDTFENIIMQHFCKQEKICNSIHEIYSYQLMPLDLANQGVDESLLSKIQHYFGQKDLIVDKYNLDITQEKIKVMRDGEWLSSEVINWWLEWWRERTGGGSLEEKKPDGKIGVGKNWFADTYFYLKLTDQGTFTYHNVQRFTRKMYKTPGSSGIFEYDKMIIPINNNNSHWYLACINFKEKRTEVYDSLGIDRPDVHKNLLRWVQEEYLDKLKINLPDGWTQFNDTDVPTQSNMYDCGVFTCMFAACVSLNLKPFDFKQNNIPLIRHWMVQVMYLEGQRLSNNNKTKQHPKIDKEKIDKEKKADEAREKINTFASNVCA